MSGRPKHDAWDKGFNRVIEDGKFFAFCLQCENYLTNTARDRLLRHRYVKKTTKIID